MYYFENGLRFECQQCGKCCRGKPGYVFVFEHEAQKIAEYLDISREQFIKEYTTKYATFYSLIEKENGDCIFWDEICTIHEVRPYQCFSYPFWWGLITSEKKWKERGTFCPGIDKGKLYSFEEIKDILKNNPYYKLLDLNLK